MENFQNILWNKQEERKNKWHEKEARTSSQNIPHMTMQFNKHSVQCEASSLIWNECIA